MSYESIYGRRRYWRVCCTTLLAATMILGGMFVPERAAAEAYIAMREGYKCSQCHVNKTGGGKRNDFSNAYVQTRLAQYPLGWLPPGEEGGESAVGNMYHGRLNDYVSLGSDFRFAYSERYVPGVKNPDRDMSIRSGLLFLQMDMLPERASLYLDQSVQGAATAREMFLLFSALPADSYVKMGRFFLASGFRLQDDSAFVRQYPGFTYGNPDNGIEIGIEPGPFSIALWTTSIDLKRGVTASVISRPARIGMSYNIDSTTKDKEKTVANVFGGLHLGRFTILAELDQIVTGTVSPVTSLASLLELDYMITKGANLKLSHDGLDPNVNVERDRVERFSLVYEPFITQFLQVGAGGRYYVGQKDNNQENRKEYFIELHGFFF